ncbi:MAG: hypothetical protein RBR81_03190 [Bacteroidales bacterium]|jgi:hypothetical protein|nr:hypothetical protein [Bacteroidales bacterium]
MSTIRETAKKVLEGNMNYANGQIETTFIGKNEDQYELFTIRTFAESEAKTNPNFFRWLFNDYGIKSYGTNLTKEQHEEYLTWLHDL